MDSISVLIRRLHYSPQSGRWPYIRQLRAFPPTHPVEAGRRVLQIVRPIAKGSTKGVTVKIETGREGGVERGEERNGRALRGGG